MPESPISVGLRLGAYDITDRLGEGGMGLVYRARDTKLGRDVAMKVLPPGLMADPDRLARFEREARVLASLNHPHITAIYGVETSNDVRALILELVDGEKKKRHAERFRHAIESGPVAHREIDTGRIYAAVGLTQQAADHLQHALALDSSCAGFVAERPAFAPYRKEPAFRELLARYQPTPR
jgi:ADP-ribosylglycohydrolase